MNRPHIIVNVAMTADGKIDSTARKGAAISSKTDKARVDRLRASVDAVLVGGRTLLNEDPKLTVKSPELRAERLQKGWPENPAKVGVISEISTKTTIGVPQISGAGRSALKHPLMQFLTSGPAQVYLFTTECVDPDLVTHFEDTGATVRAAGKDRVDLVTVFQSLHQDGIRTILVEGGGTMIAELFRLNLVDELTIYIAPKIFGGMTAPTMADGAGFLADQAPVLKLKSVEILDDEGGILVHYLRKNKE
ncbi:MAG: dihydrofolate reductase family protein [Anaerolineales bacterium]|jgi:2,5-diamino-6-(ribosylamino)-4(3H)-pyrimidinone 5'-phosphate reductase